MELLSAADIDHGRAVAEGQMVDTCRITKPGVGKGPFNEETMQYDPPPRVVVYGPGAVDDNGVPYTAATELGRRVLSGKCRIQVRSDINSNAVEGVIAEHEWTYRTATLQLPIVGSAQVMSDYEAEILTAPYDAALVGHVFNVQAETKAKTHATHRRFRIRELMS